MQLFYLTILATLLAYDCLAVENRVVNSNVATPHQFPYHVGIFLKFRVPIMRPRLLCGGTIIHDKWVLTAGHCVPPTYVGQLIIKAGKHFIHQHELTEQERNVVMTHIHSEFIPPMTSMRLVAANDIALLGVDQPFEFNEYVKPAYLPKSHDNYEGLGLLAGWGSVTAGFKPNFPKALQYNAELPVVDEQACSDAINSAIFNVEFLSVSINSNQTCTGPIGESFGACILDGGSGFVKLHSDGYEIVGIVSWSHIPCGKDGVPTVYTKVAAYREWIDYVVSTVANPIPY